MLVTHEVWRRTKKPVSDVIQVTDWMRWVKIISTGTCIQRWYVPRGNSSLSVLTSWEPLIKLSGNAVKIDKKAHNSNKRSGLYTPGFLEKIEGHAMNKGFGSHMCVLLLLSPEGTCEAPRTQDSTATGRHGPASPCWNVVRRAGAELWWPQSARRGAARDHLAPSSSVLAWLPECTDVESVLLDYLDPRRCCVVIARVDVCCLWCFPSSVVFSPRANFDKPRWTWSANMRHLPVSDTLENFAKLWVGNKPAGIIRLRLPGNVAALVLFPGACEWPRPIPCRPQPRAER